MSRRKQRPYSSEQFVGNVAIDDHGTCIFGKSQTFTPILYNVNSAGTITTLVASAKPITVTATQAPGWVTDSFTGISITGGSNYLVGVLAGPTSKGALNYYTTTGPDNHYRANTSTTTPDTNWTGDHDDPGNTFDFYLDYA